MEVPNPSEAAAAAIDAASSVMTDMGAPADMVDTMATAAQEGFDTALADGATPGDAFEAAGDSVDSAFGSEGDMGPPPDGDMAMGPDGEMGPPPEGDMGPGPDENGPTTRGDMGPDQTKVVLHQETWPDQAETDVPSPPGVIWHHHRRRHGATARW